MAVTSPNLVVERRLLAGGVRRLAALDEVGRGALAGPVTVGAVVVTADIGPVPPGLRDSKLLSAAARQRLQEPVLAWVSDVAIGHAQPAEIDEWGIIAALRIAALRALGGLAQSVDAVLLDGNIDYVSGAPTTARVVTRVKADRDCAAVAAASVLAKVSRDAIMTGLDDEFPQYQWARNKGYGTAAHATAIGRFGPCVWHRRSWRLPTGGVGSQTGGNGG